MINFQLPFPPSVNCMYANRRRGGRMKTKRYEAWLEECHYRMNVKGIMPVHERVYLLYALQSPDNRIRDDSNYSKALTDLLVDHGTIMDDDHRYVKGTFTYWKDEKGDYAEVYIIPLGGRVLVDTLELFEVNNIT